MLSLTMTKICTPFIRPLRVIDNEHRFSFILLITCLVLSMIIFDTSFLSSDNLFPYHASSEKIVFGIFSIMYVSVLGFLGHKSYDVELFCMFNFREKICNRFPKSNYSSLIKNEPLAVWSQCKMTIHEGKIAMVYEYKITLGIGM